MLLSENYKRKQTLGSGAEWIYRRRRPSSFESLWRCQSCGLAERKLGQHDGNCGHSRYGYK